MDNSHLYPEGTISALLQTDAVTDFTKNVLQQRLDKEYTAPLFFNGHHFSILSAVCDVLLAQDTTKRIGNPALEIDERLANNKADGWRYDAMPPDGIAYKTGLTGIDEFSLNLYKVPFTGLAKDGQIEILHALQQGKITGNAWAQLPPAIFFEELLAEATTLFYSHPLAQEEIGFAGMADAHGWKNIGLNEKEAIEPGEIKPIE